MRPKGEITRRIGGLARPYAVDIDEARGRVWVGLDGGGHVRVLDRSTAASSCPRAGNSAPARARRGLAHRRVLGHATVENGELIRIANSGAIGTRTGGFVAPARRARRSGPRIRAQHS